MLAANHTRKADFSVTFSLHYGFFDYEPSVWAVGEDYVGIDAAETLNELLSMQHIRNFSNQGTMGYGKLSDIMESIKVDAAAKVPIQWIRRRT